MTRGQASWAVALISAVLTAPTTGIAMSWRDCPGIIQTQTSEPPGLAACVGASGFKASQSIRVRLGDSVATMRAAASLKMQFDAGTFVTDIPVNILWRTHDREFAFDDVGGTGEAVLVLDADTPGADGRLFSISFSWQNRPLELSEAIGKARRLRAWLKDAGYRQSSDPRDAPFGVLTEGSGPPRRWADSWEAAEALLAAEPEDVEEMQLYTMTIGDTRVMASLKNMRRGSLNFAKGAGAAAPPGARRTIFDGDGGYEWLLEIVIDDPNWSPSGKP